MARVCVSSSIRFFAGAAGYSPITGFPFSMAIRWYVTGAQSASATLMAERDDDDSNPIVWMYLDTANPPKVNAFIRDIAATSASLSTVNTGALNGWHSAVLVCAATNDHKLYLDADDANKGTSSTTLADITTLDVTGVGAAVRSGRTSIVGVLDGALAESAVWNAALTLDEVTVFHKGARPHTIRPAKLKAYRPLTGRRGANGNEEDWVNGVQLVVETTAALQDHPRVLSRRQYDFVTSVVAAAANQTGTGALAPTSTLSGSGTKNAFAATVSATLKDRNGVAQASLTGLKWRFWPGSTVPNTAAPSDTGTGATTDGSGVIVVSAPNCGLVAGQTGWFEVTDSDGTTTQTPSHKLAAGPVTVT